MHAAHAHTDTHTTRLLLTRCFLQIQVIPDQWFDTQDMGIPYLFLSANPWLCSCSLDYLHEYLQEFETSVYVRNGTVIDSNAKSVVGILHTYWPELESTSCSYWLLEPSADFCLLLEPRSDSTGCVRVCIVILLAVCVGVYWLCVQVCIVILLAVCGCV